MLLEMEQIMAQQIYNNYSPQYHYHQRSLPQQIQTSVMPVNYTTPDVFQPQVQTGPVPVLQQVAQRIPQEAYKNYYDPNTAPVIRNIFNQPDYSQYYYSTPQITNHMPAPPVNATQQTNSTSWTQDPELSMAMNKLAEITHDPADIAYLHSIGVNPPHNSGREAVDFILQNNISVEFADMGDTLAHAQYINDEKKIIINKKYQGQMTQPMALAIADAIYHEAGHAKDRDDVSSIQEELDCLALNVLGYRYQQRKYPQILNASGQSRLLSDGVALYPKLFFDSDPNKTALMKRVAEKYGFLPTTTPNHEISSWPLAQAIKQSYINLNPQA